jgi:hypothetical protein
MFCFNILPPLFRPKIDATAPRKHVLDTTQQYQSEGPTVETTQGPKDSRDLGLVISQPKVVLVVSIDPTWGVNALVIQDGYGKSDSHLNWYSRDEFAKFRGAREALERYRPRVTKS